MIELDDQVEQFLAAASPFIDPQQMRSPNSYSAWGALKNTWLTRTAPVAKEGNPEMTKRPGGYAKAPAIISIDGAYKPANA